MLPALDRRDYRPGAGGDEDVPRAVVAPVHLHRVRIDDRGAAADDFHAGRREQPLVNGVEPRDLLVLVRKQRGPFEAWFAARPAVGLGDLEFLAPVRRVGEELLRDAADVDAGAAEA